MKTPEKKSKNARPAGLLQLGLITALGITLVGFEYANVDLIRKKVSTAKMEAVEDEIIYDDFEVERPEVPVDNPEPEQRQTNSTSTTTQQLSTNVQITQNQNQVTTNIGVNTGDSVVIVQNVFGTQKVDLSDKIFDIVEEMPTYKDLLKEKDLNKRRSLTEKEMLQYIYKTIKYPEMARQTGIQGKVYVQFVVEKDGSIADVTVLKGVHSDLDKEAVRAVNTLPKMLPGKQLDKEVKVRFTIPIIFSLKN